MGRTNKMMVPPTPPPRHSVSSTTTTDPGDYEVPVQWAAAAAIATAAAAAAAAAAPGGIVGSGDYSDYEVISAAGSDSYAAATAAAAAAAGGGGKNMMGPALAGSLSHILQDDSAVDLLLAHCIETLQVEPILFWLDAEQWANFEGAHRDAVSYAATIVKKYIRPGAQLQIFLPGAMRRSLVARVAALEQQEQEQEQVQEQEQDGSGGGDLTSGGRITKSGRRDTNSNIVAVNVLAGAAATPSARAALLEMQGRLQMQHAELTRSLTANETKMESLLTLAEHYERAGDALNRRQNADMRTKIDALQAIIEREAAEHFDIYTRLQSI
eukprot:UC1_evm1s404